MIRNAKEPNKDFYKWDPVLDRYDKNLKGQANDGLDSDYPHYNAVARNGDDFVNSIEEYVLRIRRQHLDSKDCISLLVIDGHTDAGFGNSMLLTERQLNTVSEYLSEHATVYFAGCDGFSYQRGFAKDFHIQMACLLSKKGGTYVSFREATFGTSWANITCKEKHPYSITINKGDPYNKGYLNSIKDQFRKAKMSPNRGDYSPANGGFDKRFSSTPMTAAEYRVLEFQYWGWFDAGLVDSPFPPPNVHP